MTELELGPLRFGIIGAGRLGCTIGRALQARGFGVVHASSASPDGRERAAHVLDVPVHEDPVAAASQVDCIVLCVPDDRLDAVVQRLTQRPADASPIQLRVVSTSADGGLRALAPLARLGHLVSVLHPVASVADDAADPAVLVGAGAAVGADDEPGRVFAHALAHALGLHPFDLTEAAWPLHAAARTAAANLVAATFGVAQSLAAEAGVHPDVARAGYGRLAQASIERCIRAGADSAIGGAIVRGDAASLARQLDGVAGALPGATEFMREGLRSAVSRVAMAGRIDVAASHDLEAAIGAAARSGEGAT
ncbi:MAG: hypothetical protein JWM98_738 [Thermoleophilia bacterium]|nr:hypothetical protein [Thermoleophilia bacterium]